MMHTPSPRGFTLVETLVAITIIALAMVGPLYAVQQALNASRSARDMLITSSLAQEAIEYVRYVRDSNYLYVLNNPGSTRSWLYGFDGTGGTEDCADEDCIVDPTQNEVSQEIAPLYLSETNLYNQEELGTVTPYTRKIRFAGVPGACIDTSEIETCTEVTITVTMTWTTKNIPYTVTISEHLHNWL